MSILMQDLKLAIRQMWRRPGFTLVAVLTLAIGMGVNAVAFTVVNGLLFKGFIVSATDGAGRILTTPGGDEAGNASLEEYRRFARRHAGRARRRGRGPAVAGVAPRWHRRNRLGHVRLARTTSRWSTARPIAGRVDVGQRGASAPSVVIGERFWRRKLNAASIAGLTLRLNDTDVSVAGVLPDSFTGPAGTLLARCLAAARRSRAVQHARPRCSAAMSAGCSSSAGFAPGMSVPEVTGTRRRGGGSDGARLARHAPRARRALSTVQRRNSELRGLTTAAAIAMGIIGLVLLLACFNVTNLLLARAVERERDMGIRAAHRRQHVRASCGSS